LNLLTDRKYLAFDLETAKVQSPYLRDWKLRRPLGICCAATYCGGSKQPILWYGGKRKKCPAARMAVVEAKDLVDYLSRQVTCGYTIVTWNGIGFDFDILAEESGMHDECNSLAIGHVDMMFHVLCQLGFGVSLNAAARGMRLTRKCEKRPGSLVPKHWADGEYDKVFNHVAQDVRVTLELATTCNQCSYVRWITRFGTGRMMRLPNGWQKVGDAQKLPEPIQSQERGQWSRNSLTAWMRSIG
jgi:RNase_H superfamily